MSCMTPTPRPADAPVCFQTSLSALQTQRQPMPSLTNVLGTSPQHPALPGDNQGTGGMPEKQGKHKQQP